MKLRHKALWRNGRERKRERSKLSLAYGLMEITAKGLVATHHHHKNAADALTKLW